MTTPCPVCGGTRNPCFDAVVLSKYRVQYLLCPHCGLLQTEQPYWMEEAYAAAISIYDTGLLARNINLVPKLACLLYQVGGLSGRYLDVAGGYGVLVRLMRDLGFDYYWSDKYSPNLFAQGFEGAAAQQPFAAVTAFEAVEHMPDPMEFLRATLSEAGCRTILFSTWLYGDQPPKPGEWWYYSFATGQHVSFFQLGTLERMARNLGLRLYSRGGLHLMTDHALAPWAYRVMTGRYAQALFPWVKSRLRRGAVAEKLKLEARLAKSEAGGI